MTSRARIASGFRHFGWIALVASCAAPEAPPTKADVPSFDGGATDADVPSQGDATVDADAAAPDAVTLDADATTPDAVTMDADAAASDAVTMDADAAPDADAAVPDDVVVDVPADDGTTLPDSVADSASADRVTPPVDAAVDPDLWVAPDGSGTLCTRAAPCALVTARDAARTRTLTGDLHVWLRGGTYALRETFELGAADSGRDGHAIVYEAVAGERPVLSGGVTLPNTWTLWDAARGVWRIALPTGLRARQLWVDGRRAVRARGPRAPAGFVETATGYTAPDVTMAGWRHPEALEVVGFQHWKSFRCGVASIAGRAITMRQPCWGSAQAHMGYTLDLPEWWENALELLDDPGEFWFDPVEPWLYYRPRGGEDLARAAVVVPSLETLVRARGTIDAPVHDVRFRGVGFTYATWRVPDGDDGYAVLQAGVVSVGTPRRQMKTPGNVALAGAHHVAFEGCAFEHLGGAGLSIDDGSHDDTVTGCRFEDISSAALSIGDVTRETDHHPSDPRTTVRGVTARDNFITRAGAEYFDAVGIFVGYTERTTLDHNDLFDLPYSGISVGWGWGGVDPGGGRYTTPSACRENAITHNLVSHHVRVLDDAGGIYVLGAQPGASMSGNWIDNQGNVYGSLYLDNGTQNYTVTSNLVTLSPHWLYVQVYDPIARNNTVTGNFSDADTWFRPRPVDASNVVRDNTVYTGARPAAAEAIAASAGLEAPWRAMHPPDVARGRAARASSEYAAAYAARFASDGDMRTGWSPTGTDPNPWWQLDLGASRDVSGVELVTRWELDQPVTRQNFAVWLSDDATFATHVELGAYATPPLAHRAIWTARAPAAMRARYVRVLKTRAEYFYLGEVRVLGGP